VRGAEAGARAGGGGGGVGRLEGRATDPLHLQLHLHVQDTATSGEGTSQNPYFGPIRIEVTGKKLHAEAWPLIRGLFVASSLGAAADSRPATALPGADQ